MLKTTEIRLSSNDIERYSRQLLLPQFGVAGQKKLKRSRILIVGIGGLGSPAALYLAGAGVGTLGLVDRPTDVVEVSNLHRQLAHSEARVGTNKVKSAEVAIRAINSNVSIEKHESFLPANAIQLVSSYHLVLDCTDNVASRYLVGDACAAAKIPLLSGSAIGMDGQLAMYCGAPDSPCYRCIFPNPPPPNCVGSCDASGVLGPVPGLIGTLQGLEAIKLLSCMGQTESLDRKLLLFDASECSFRSVKLRSRLKSCIACGDSASISVADFDYDLFAQGGTCENGDNVTVTIERKHQVTPQEFAEFRKDRSTYRLIDVRPHNEFDICHLEEAENQPLATLKSPGVLDEFQPEKLRTILLCRRGNSSQKALKVFLDSGITNVCEVQGGLQAWHYKIDSTFPLY